MDAKTELNKILKDVQASAKEFAHYSLTMTSKALDVAATRLKSLEQDLKARAEKLAPDDVPNDGAAAEPPVNPAS